MALIQDNKTKLYLQNQSGDFGASKKNRFPVEQAVRYAQILREKGFDVTAVLDTGGSCEQTQTVTAVNETINYVDQFGRPIDWRIAVTQVQAGYMHRWVDSDTKETFQIIQATPQLVFERLRDVEDMFSERHIAELPRVTPVQLSQEVPQAQAQNTPGLRPGDSARYNGEQPTYRSYYNPNNATAEAAPASAGYEAWERASSVAALKKRYETDPAFAAWYDGVGKPATNRQ